MASAKKATAETIEETKIERRYEFTGEKKDWDGRTLRQIRSLVTIAGLGVAPGHLGGWIESEANLPHDGTAWVFPLAHVSGEKTLLRGGTFWGGTFRGGTFWGGTFWGGTSTNIQPIFLAGLTWPVTITDEHMSIGCQTHALTAWWGFDDTTIDEMDRQDALTFWKAHKPLLQSLCLTTGRPASQRPKLNLPRRARRRQNEEPSTAG